MMKNKLITLLSASLLLLITSCQVQWNTGYENLFSDLETEYLFYADEASAKNDAENKLGISQRYKIGSIYKNPADGSEIVQKLKYGFIPTGWAIYSGTQDEDKSGNKIVNLETCKIYATGWNGKSVTYTVRHWEEKKDCGKDTFTSEDYNEQYFEKVKDEPLTGKVEEKTAAVAQPKQGFSTVSFEQCVIEPDGKTILDIYYTRNPVKIKVYGLEELNDTTGKEFNGKYGNTFTVSDIKEIEHYSRKGWYKSYSEDELKNNLTACEVIDNLPSEYPLNDIYLKAIFEHIKAEYTVMYWFENPDTGEYEKRKDIQVDQKIKCDEGVEITDSMIWKLDFTNKHYLHESCTKDKIVKPDNSSCVNHYYKLERKTVTFNLDGGTSNIKFDEGSTNKFTARYGQKITAAAPQKEGYIFISWEREINGTKDKVYSITDYQIEQDCSFTAVYEVAVIKLENDDKIFAVEFKPAAQNKVTDSGKEITHTPVTDSGKTEIKFTAPDSDDVKQYIWQINGVEVPDSDKKECSYDVTSLTSGSYQLILICVKEDGSIEITVQDFTVTKDNKIGG